MKHIQKSYPFQTTFLHEDEELWFRSIDKMKELFNKYGPQLKGVCTLAEHVKVLIDNINDDIEEMTSQNCPECESVCCINQHSYPEHEDLVYLLALGEEPPEYEPSLDDKAPCRFLSLTGCTLKRTVRPFRCSWYFCTSLVQYMDSHQGRKMRKYSRKAQSLIDARRQMIEEFLMVIDSHGISF